MSAPKPEYSFGPKYIGLGSHDVRPTDSSACSFLLAATYGRSWLHPAASNYTFLVELSMADVSGYAIYKPKDGESPLRDFPSGTLYQREVATYELDRLLGWGIVPPTVVRDGDAGVGSLQLFVPPIPGSNYFSIRDEYAEKLLHMAVFDIIANNADRKGGHCFVDSAGDVWGVDHGLTFHEWPKLRTVIWDFAGEPVPSSILDDLRRLSSILEATQADGTCVLAELLSVEEIGALIKRAEELILDPFFPSPSSRRDLPWPWV